MTKIKKRLINAYPVAEKAVKVGEAWGYTCAVLATGEIATSSAYVLKTSQNPSFFCVLIPITLGSGLAASILAYGAEKLVGITPSSRTPKWVISLQYRLLSKKHKPKLISRR